MRGPISQMGLCVFIERFDRQAQKMGHWLRALDALLEDNI